MTIEDVIIPYPDFCAKLAKPGDVMDKEISILEEQLMEEVFHIADHANTIASDVFLFNQYFRPIHLRLKHMAFGLVGEAGELLDAIKKIVIYRKFAGVFSDTLSIAYNVVEEVGDLMFYYTEWNTIRMEQGHEPEDGCAGLTFIDKINNFINLWNKQFPNCSFTLEDAITLNKHKLAKRYPGLSYTDKKAHDRADKQEEVTK